MPLLDKSTCLTEAIARIGDGARVMIGGFGVPGTPFTLIEALVRQGPKNLTIIKNDANEPGMGVDWLLCAGMVSRLITSHVGLNSNAVRMMNAGEIEVEFVAQGILAERIRTAGAGLKGFVTDIGIGTLLSEGKQTVEMDGATFLIEPALEADFALVHAARADTFGNLVIAATARTSPTDGDGQAVSAPSPERHENDRERSRALNPDAVQTRPAPRSNHSGPACRNSDESLTVSSSAKAREIMAHARQLPRADSDARIDRQSRHRLPTQVMAHVPPLPVCPAIPKTAIAARRPHGAPGQADRPPT